MLDSLLDSESEDMRSRYICFWGPLPVMRARIGGRLLGDVVVLP